MKNQLFNILDEYAKGDCIRFHVPGHKGRNDNPIYKYDITELPFSDDLNAPMGLLRDAEEKMSKIYNSYYTIFTVNGSSAAIMAAIMCCVKENEKLLLPSDSHLSCYYGAMHAGATIVKLPLKDHILGISSEELEYAVDNIPDIRACVITSPTYFGCGTELKQICKILKEKNIRLIVDESHGAHLPLGNGLPENGLNAGADIVVHSTHKTIGALTQTAMIHVNCKDILQEDLRFYLRSVQSTSPSYILINSILDIIPKLENSEGYLENLKLWYNKVSSRLADFKKFELLGFGDRTDPSKISIRCKVSMKEFSKCLNNAGIVPEMICGDIVVFALGFGTVWKDCEVLLNTIESAECLLNPNYTSTSRPYVVPALEQAMSIRQSQSFAKEWINIKDSAGRISADFINVYPPGASCAIPGDILTDEAINYILSASEVHGIKNGKVRVLTDEG